MGLYPFFVASPTRFARWRQITFYFIMIPGFTEKKEREMEEENVV
jgi:hypothetical protein